MPDRDDVTRELDRHQDNISDLWEKHDGLLTMMTEMQVRVAILENNVAPIKRIMWGFAGLVLTVVILAILRLVIPGAAMRP